jgi:hypothetical protein
MRDHRAEEEDLAEPGSGLADGRLRLVDHPPGAGRPRCSKCGVVIGVFEPLVAHVDGRMHVTSLAAHDDIGFARGSLFHEACHADC